VREHDLAGWVEGLLADLDRVARPKQVLEIAQSRDESAARRAERA
jgi:hypothetical protein